ncbi:uncharacterized protein EV420DRAFT_1142985 [Desarmillaria tabescens]|uniref:Uncharacterized protein n=1 Tax=Armillaria tabescens TaxID=1929756 RepID=A0AA39TQE3_ARMTA|nr:uncharacterized protein EV420DRAFT_1142985 [Desarmillaria tabescens]KAK0462883.1 hypothetical protein EV420DRAFT_1142985 [Desarmillaria tabescens]
MSSSPTENASYSLKLDPGIPRRKKSALSCCKWSAVILGLLIGLLVCVAVYKFSTAFADVVRHPHRALYRNGSLEEQAVVRPLIDDNQQFDIAVSVWLRASKEEEDEWRRLSSTIDDEDYSDNMTFRFPLDMGNKVKGIVYRVVDKYDPNYEIYLKGDKKLLYTPLYSDIAFRGVSFKDKNVLADVKFQIPTSRFLDKNLATSDLRGTFVLIPSSKSLLKHVTNFSSWMPDAVYDNLPPVRPWPFPLGSSFYADKTVADLAVDSFGISVPLLQFSEIQGRCGNSSANTTDQASLTSEDIATMDPDSVRAKLKQMKENTPAYKNHPHVVTRTKLHVVDETHVFDKEAYDKAHQSLRSTSCGQHPGTSAKPSRKFCKDLSFSEGGVLRTSLELEVPNADGEYERHWAYGPFMNTIPAAAGPKDIIPIPINRENCSVSVDGHAEVPELMDITWRISFSGRSPGKHLLSTIISQPYGVDNNYNRTDYEKAMDQNKAELINGLRGVRFHDKSHPRRRSFIELIQIVAELTSYTFELLYWFTRNHTTSISNTGALLRASVLAIESCLDLGEALRSKVSAFELLMTVMLSFIFGFQLPLYMFKTALRLEFALTRKGIFGMSLTIPMIRRMPKTHKERSSERLDKRTNWKMILCTLLAVYYITRPLKHHVIDALHPPMPEQEFSYIAEYVTPGLCATVITARNLQIMLNYRSKVFAGNSRTSTYLNLLVVLLGWMGYVPALVGKPESRPSVSFHECILSALCMFEAYQAFGLPNASQMEDGKDNE